MTSRSVRARLAALLLLASVAISRGAAAETLQAPFAGKPIPLGEARVACAPPGGGWTLDATGRSLKPPDAASAVGTSVELKVAPSLASCASASRALKLLTTGRAPEIDPASVVLSPDLGRVEAKGRHLAGVAVIWRSNTTSGTDVCQEPKLDGGEHCAWNIGHGVSASPGSALLTFLPAGAQSGADVTSFDADGKPLDANAFSLGAQHVVLGSLLPPDASIDLSSGRGEVELTHPEAVIGVDCGAARCEIVRNSLIVRSLSSNVSSVDVKFRLAPGAALGKGQTLDATPTAHLSVVHCPMTLLSGQPLHGVDNVRAVVRIEGRCASELPNLHFFSGNDAIAVLGSQVDSAGADVLLALGNLQGSSLTLTAVDSDAPGVAVAVAHVETASPPQASASLEIPGHRNLSFIPTNRPAIVHLPKLSGEMQLVPLPVEGVYTVTHQGDDYLVTGDPNAAGLASLRFGYRSKALHGAFADTDLAVLQSPLQRSVHEANLPAPIGGSALGPNPLVELVCGVAGRGTVRVAPGVTEHLPFESRDNCRVIFHRERLPPEYGTQKLTLDIDVLDSDGAARGEGHVSETIVLKPGAEPLYAWIQGVKSPFDRVMVRLSHAADEAHYVGALEIRTGAPEVKWTAVLGTGHARLYATTTIPTGLYRFGDKQHSGVLSLNFGVVSRLTWLGTDGHEGFLGLEGGIMAIGLTNDTGASGQSLTQVGVVTGLGLSVPIANRSSPTQAAINLHGWFEVDISHSSTSGRPTAFIFGPSISIGNVGTNL